MNELSYQERQRQAKRDSWRRKHWDGYAEKYPVKPRGNKPHSDDDVMAHAVEQARKASLRFQLHEFQIIHCKMCKLPFMRKELPASSSRCRPCRKVLKHRRRALKIGSGGTCSQAQWEAVLALYGNKCQRCGSADNLTRDHIIPLSLGGSDDPTNLQPLCFICNSTKCNVMTGAVQAFIPGVKLTF